MKLLLKTNTGKQLGVKLTRHAPGEGELDLGSRAFGEEAVAESWVAE